MAERSEIHGTGHEHEGRDERPGRRVDGSGEQDDDDEGQRPETSRIAAAQAMTNNERADESGAGKDFELDGGGGRRSTNERGNGTRTAHGC